MGKKTAKVIRTYAQNVKVKRQAEGSDDLVIEGYAIKWSDQYNTKYWSEKIAKGAFVDSLSERDVAVLNGHKMEQVIASTRSGTTVKENDTGLKFEVLLNKSQIARDVYAMVDNDDVQGVSVGMEIDDYEYYDTGGNDDNALFIVIKAKLHEFSMTAFPAYTDTEAVARDSEDLDESRQKIIADYRRATKTEDTKRARRLRLAKAKLKLVE